LSFSAFISVDERAFLSMARHQIILICGIVLYLIACATPALSFRVFTENPAEFRVEKYVGGTLLLVGCLGMLQGQFAWLANPLLVSGVFLMLIRRPRVAIVPLVIAILITFCTLAGKSRQFAHDEGGVSKMTLEQILPGFYLWVASISIILAAALFWPRTSMSQTPPKNSDP
jgi:4-amino-4-deoxy-L-arabinose transferase-like glycosyltransferase